MQQASSTTWKLYSVKCLLIMTQHFTVRTSETSLTNGEFDYYFTVHMSHQVMASRNGVIGV